MKASVVIAQASTFTVSEVARILRIGRGTAYRLVRTHEIPSIRLGDSIRVPRAALERLLSAQTERGGNRS
jgi:excisionase family DNA binding protein